MGNEILQELKGETTHQCHKILDECQEWIVCWWQGFLGHLVCLHVSLAKSKLNQNNKRSIHLKGVIFLLGGVKLSLLKIFPNVVLFTPISGTDGFLSVADNLLFWFLREVLKLSSLARSLVDMFLMFLCSPLYSPHNTDLTLPRPGLQYRPHICFPVFFLMFLGLLLQPRPGQAGIIILVLEQENYLIQRLPAALIIQPS